MQPNGREAIKSLLLEGDLFGSVRALEPGGRTSFAAIALEDCHAWRIAFAALEAAAAQHPAWQRLLTRAFRQLAWRKEERERELLTLTPAQRYERLLETRPAIVGRVSQADLALFLGLVQRPAGQRVCAGARRQPGWMLQETAPSWVFAVCLATSAAFTGLSVGLGQSLARKLTARRRSLHPGRGM